MPLRAASVIPDVPHRFTVRPLSEGGGYLIEFPDLPGCMSDGETIEEDHGVRVRRQMWRMVSHVSDGVSDK